ncbi:MAG: hypothetical protein ACRYFY_20800 [Janthinobacterium lividum]
MRWEMLALRRTLTPTPLGPPPPHGPVAIAAILSTLPAFRCAVRMQR